MALRSLGRQSMALDCACRPGGAQGQVRAPLAQAALHVLTGSAPHKQVQLANARLAYFHLQHGRGVSARPARRSGERSAARLSVGDVHLEVLGGTHAVVEKPLAVARAHLRATHGVSCSQGARSRRDTPAEQCAPCLCSCQQSPQPPRTRSRARPSYTAHVSRRLGNGCAGGGVRTGPQHSPSSPPEQPRRRRRRCCAPPLSWAQPRPPLAGV